MPLKIFSDKKSLIAGRKVIFYIYAAIAISISFLFIVWIVPTSKSEIAMIPPNLENYLLSQRFLSSPECFTYEDESINKVYPWRIDLEKFNQDSLNSCYNAIDTDVKAYTSTINYDGIPEIPVPDKFSSTCNIICADRKCIMGIDDNKYKTCGESIKFEESKDYCMCGSDSERVIPVPTDIQKHKGDQSVTPPIPRTDCNNFCRGVGKGCIAGVNNHDVEECDNTFKFDKGDDYCFCGKDSEKVIPVPYDFHDTCNNICTLGNCIMGVESDNNKLCGELIKFDKSDDFCICGGGSDVVVPRPDEKRSTCDVECGNKGCISAWNQNKNVKKDNSIKLGCYKSFEFDNNDDYCHCEDGTEEIPVPDKQFKSCFDVCIGEGKVGCIRGIKNDDEEKRCGESFDFDKSNDYCICGGGSVEKVPGHLSYDPNCNTICGSSPDTSDKCIMGIEDNNKNRACNREFDFDANDDYCICRSDSETIIPVPDDFESTCNDICRNKGKGCIAGANNHDVKECDNTFKFDKGDDYCFCGKDSEKVIPVPYDIKESDTPIKTNCNTFCGSPSNCIMGIGDDNDEKKCGELLDFDQNDDYCICGTGSEVKIPVEKGNTAIPDDDPSATCNIQCGDLDCVTGVNDGNNKRCNEKFEFNADDDYCICRSGSEEIIPVPDEIKNTACNTICSNIGKGCILGDSDGTTKKCSELIKKFNGNNDNCTCAETTTISTLNWEGTSESAETSPIFVYDAGVIQRGSLVIGVQNAK